MNNNTHIEYEIALNLSETCPNQVRSWLQQLPNCAYQRSTQLLNIYYDTPEQSLRQAKAALRLRYDTEAQCWIQTLKSAGVSINGVSQRGEWEATLPDTKTETDSDNDTNNDGTLIPQWRFDLFAADAQALLNPLRERLHAVFHTDFRRDIYDYRLGEQHFEWALDQGEVRLSTESGAHNDAARSAIKDLEIELKHGDLAQMQQLATQAQAALNASPQTQSKAARGYALLQSID